MASVDTSSGIIAQDSESNKNFSVELNDDVMLEICMYLNAGDLFNMENVCKRWRDLSARALARKQSIHFDHCFSSLSGKSFTNWHLKRIITHCGSNLKSVDISAVTGLCKNSSIIMIAKMCPNLQELKMGSLQTGKSVMVSSANMCEKLEKVCGMNDSVSDEGLRLLINYCQNLKYLDVSHNIGIRGKFFSKFGPNLKVLKLNNCEQIVSSGFTEIAYRCPELIELHLHSATKITDNSIRLICTRCVKITKLDLGGSITDVTPYGLRQIKELKHLEELYLSENKTVQDEVLVAISEGCKQLRVLDVSACSNSISDYGVKSLANRLELVTLNISYLKKVTNYSLMKLGTSCPLEKLTTRCCLATSDAGFQSVIRLCPRLKCLDLSGCTSVTKALLITATEVIAHRDNGIKLEIIVGGTAIPERASHIEHPLLDINSFDYSSKSLMPSCYDVSTDNFLGEDDYDDDPFHLTYDFERYDDFGEDFSYNEAAWPYDG